MKRRTKRVIDLDRAKRVIEAAGWEKNDPRAVALIESIEQKHKSPAELKKATQQRKNIVIILEKMNKLSKAVQDAKQALRDVTSIDDPKKTFETFTNLNNKVEALGGNKVNLNLSHIQDLVQPQADTPVLAETQEEQGVDVVTATQDSPLIANEHVGNNESSPFFDE